MPSEQELIGKLKTGTEFPKGHKLLQNEKEEWFYIVPKHAPFYKFGEMYLGTPGLPGESINQSSLMKAVKHKAKILFVYPYYIYEIEAQEFGQIAVRMRTARMQHSTGEMTYSVPLNAMKCHKRQLL